jgi:transposase-like protein
MEEEAAYSVMKQLHTFLPQEPPALATDGLGAYREALLSTGERFLHSAVVEDRQPVLNPRIHGNTFRSSRNGKEAQLLTFVQKESTEIQKKCESY